MAKRDGLTQEAVQGIFTEAFRLNAGSGLSASVSLKTLSDKSGVSHRALKSYQSGDNTPQLRNLLLLINALPDSFANEIFFPIHRHVVNFNKPGTLVNTLVLNKMLANLLHLIATALMDEVIDHQETKDMEPLVKLTLSACNDWLAGLKEDTRLKRE